jgi:hypothetical protein
MKHCDGRANPAPAAKRRHVIARHEVTGKRE